MTTWKPAKDHPFRKSALAATSKAKMRKANDLGVRRAKAGGGYGGGAWTCPNCGSMKCTNSECVGGAF